MVSVGLLLAMRRSNAVLNLAMRRSNAALNFVLLLPSPLPLYRSASNDSLLLERACSHSSSYQASGLHSQYIHRRRNRQPWFNLPELIGTPRDTAPDVMACSPSPLTILQTVGSSRKDNSHVHSCASSLGRPVSCLTWDQGVLWDKGLTMLEIRNIRVRMSCVPPLFTRTSAVRRLHVELSHWFCLPYIDPLRESSRLTSLLGSAQE